MRIKYYDDYPDLDFDDPGNGPRFDFVADRRRNLDRIFGRKPGDKEWKFDQFKKKEKQCE